jgi:Zn-dependent metalloprotease
MAKCCPANCIVPPHILRHLLESEDAEVRRIALNTLLATTQMRAERKLMQFGGFVANGAGTKNRTIFNCANASTVTSAAILRAEGAGPVKDASANAAYDGFGATYDFFRTVLGRNSLDNRGMRLEGYVHYGQSYNNAFWNGRQMLFGDGDGVLFTDFTGSLDVIAHELGHGVTQFTAGLAYHNQSGALNESMSDVFGSMVKQWALKQDAAKADWLIGADIFTPRMKGDALRSMKNPGTAYDNPTLGKDPQPKHMKNYQKLPDNDEGDWGGVHINSGIPNHAFYLAATAIGGKSWEAAGRIWYESLRESEPETDFAAFASKTFLYASNHYGAKSAEAKAVKAAWTGVGVAVGVKVAKPARAH